MEDPGLDFVRTICGGVKNRKIDIKSYTLVNDGLKKILSFSMGDTHNAVPTTERWQRFIEEIENRELSLNDIKVNMSRIGEGIRNLISYCSYPGRP